MDYLIKFTYFQSSEFKEMTEYIPIVKITCNPKTLSPKAIVKICVRSCVYNEFPWKSHKSCKICQIKMAKEYGQLHIVSNNPTPFELNPFQGLACNHKVSVTDEPLPLQVLGSLVALQ